jgi:hypothetical protein
VISQIAEACYNQDVMQWKHAIGLITGNYIETHKWLKIAKHFDFE